jgi:tetratricopeptide (TPR) repeat protein
VVVSTDPDPRDRQLQFLVTAQKLLQVDESSLSLDSYRAAQKRLRALLSSASAADSVYLALALLDQSHAPSEAFGTASSAPGAAPQGGGLSRARAVAVIGSLEQAVAANPANLAALWHLASLHESFDDARAVAVWQDLLAHAPGHLQAMGRLGEGLLLLEQSEQAQLVWVQTLALAEARGRGREAGRARNVLGRLYLRHGQYQLAEEMFKSAAVDADGSHWGCAYQSLGQLYSTLGEVAPPTNRGDAP